MRVYDYENCDWIADRDYSASLNLEKGNSYPFKFFFAERHTTQSNFILETSIEFDSTYLTSV